MNVGNMMSIELSVMIVLVIVGHFCANPTTTTTTTTTTTKKITTEAPLNCSAYHSCGPCTKSKKCYWCGPTEKCFDYPNKIVPTSCPSNKWYWKQCFLPAIKIAVSVEISCGCKGYVLIIVVPALAGLILLTCGCCIYCKCCRESGKSWKKEEERITQRRKDRQLKAEERKAARKEKTDAVRMKYGLLKSDDEEPLV